MGRGISDLERVILIQGYEDEGNLYYCHRGKIRKKLAEIRGGQGYTLSASVSRAIRNLERRGLVERKTYGEWNHSLTEEGMKRGKNLKEFIEHWEKEVR